MNNNRFKITSFDAIEEEKVDWLWEPYIACGTLTCIIGDPGVGKSFLSTYIASKVSSGDGFLHHDDAVHSRASIHGNVIIQNSEDSKGGTIKNRLENNGANLTKVLVIELENKNDSRGDLTIIDINVLRDYIEEYSPKLIIFDPLTSFLGNTDMNSATKVRSVMQPISSLASEFNISIIFIAHRNKGIQGGNQAHKMLGSVDFVAISRSIISVGINPNNKEETLFMHTKSNLAKKGKTLAFKILDEKVHWLGERDYIVDDDLLNDDVVKSSRIEEAKSFILEYLNDNNKALYESMFQISKDLGISKSTLERARNELKDSNVIKNIREGNNSYWCIVENDYSNTHISNSEEMSKWEY